MSLKEYTGGSCSNDPNFSMVFRETYLKVKFGERAAAGYVTFFSFFGGKVTGGVLGISILSLSNQSGSSAGTQPRVNILHLGGDFHSCGRTQR